MRSMTTTTTQLEFDYIVPTDLSVEAKKLIAANVYKWTTQLVSRLQDSYGRDGDREGQFSITVGKKYYKIIQKSGGVHALLISKLVKFINQRHGDHQQSTLDMI